MVGSKGGCYRPGCRLRDRGRILRHAVASSDCRNCVRALFGLFPIGWIVFAAVFLFTLTVDSGDFERVKHSVMAISPDRRVQAVLIAFCFGAFLEGAAGFGAPVAISSALMIGAGFPPLYAAGLALMANTAPVAFGALGTPTITLAKVTGLDELKLSAMAGRQLPFFSVIIPAWMVWRLSGWSGVRGVWPAIAVSGGVFAVLQFLISNFHGPSLVDIAAGLGSFGALTLLLRWWQPREVWSFGEQTAVELASARVAESRGRIAAAWMPWAILSLFAALWGWPSFRAYLNGGVATPSTSTTASSSAPASVAWWQRPNRLAGITELSWAVPYLHEVVLPDATVLGGEAEPKPAIYRLNWLSATGTGILAAAILSAFWMRTPPRRFVELAWSTLVRLRASLLTIALMMGLAYLTQFCGSDVTLGLAFIKTGVAYPVFAALLGWVGVAVTGSDSSCNALFGNLQRITAERLGLNPVLICTANSTGGVMGKMIDAQSIVVASAATGQGADESSILRFVFWPSFLLATLVGLLTLIQAHWLTMMIP